MFERQGKIDVFAQLEVAGLNQSLGSKDSGENVTYSAAIIFNLAIPHFTRSFSPSYKQDKLAKFMPV